MDGRLEAEGTGYSKFRAWRMNEDTELAWYSGHRTGQGTLPSPNADVRSSLTWSPAQAAGSSRAWVPSTASPTTPSYPGNSQWPGQG